MDKKTLKVAPEFYTVLVEQQLDNFTIMELRDAIIDVTPSDSELSPQQQQKRAYRLVHRLIKKSLFSASKKIGTHIRYGRTAEFTKVRLQAKGTPIEKTKTPTSNLSATHAAKRYELQRLLDEYQVELLSALEETNEYKRLNQKMPELSTLLEPMHLETREKSSRAFGKIEAVKKVMNSLESHVR